MEKLLALYQSWRGESPLKIDSLPGAGSNRSYYRITGTDGRTVIGVVGTSRDENHAFIYLTHHFNTRMLPVRSEEHTSELQSRI